MFEKGRGLEQRRKAIQKPTRLQPPDLGNGTASAVPLSFQNK
jgi:hypothetical protein